LLKKNEQYLAHANKGRKQVIFKPGDYVWVHLRKERFPSQRKSKLQSRGDGPFQVLEKVNDNAYKIDLPGEYGVSATFNVADLTPYDMPDSRSNPFQEREDDEGSSKEISSKSDATIIQGPITRSKAKKLLNGVTKMVLDTFEGYKHGGEAKLVTLCMVEDIGVH
jgi:hypothetical protein